MEDRFREHGQGVGEDAAVFVQGLAKESDRSAVILGAARLDVSLERLLKAVMSHHPGGNDNLFDGDRPLSTFSAKIAVAHRLRLIDNDVEHALQMVRKIRNDFAHSVEEATLSVTPNRDRAMELAKTVSKDRYYSERRDKLREIVGRKTLADFCAAMTVLIINLETSVIARRDYSRQEDWSKSVKFR